MLTLIRSGTLLSPTPLEGQSLLMVGERIARLGSVEEAALASLGVPYEVVDATGCVVVPGLVDPHQHLIGAGGEQGFVSRMPEVRVEQLLLAGITTVVGCLGTDGTTRNLAALVGKVRQLQAQGVTALMYTGGFHVPPRTITGSVTDDLMLIDCIIGVGELAIADVRSSQPTVDELARVVSMALVGGRGAGKAGVTHFHTGPGRAQLSQLHAERVASVREHGLSLPQVLPFFTSNPATALKLRRKGRLAPGMDGDVLVLDEKTLQPVHVFTRGQPRVRQGRVIEQPREPV